MKKQDNGRRGWFSVLTLMMVLLAGVGLALADGTTGESEAESTGDTGTSSSAGKKPLDGGKVYAWNCGACHSERWPKERSDAEWEVIMTHMRVRANLTAAQTEAVLDYLQENNG